VIKTIGMGRRAGAAGGQTARETIYDNNEGTNDVVVIDTHTLTIRTRWSVKPAGQAVAIALDKEHHRLFSAGRNPTTLVMMDADSGKSAPVISPSLPELTPNIYDPTKQVSCSIPRAQACSTSSTRTRRIS